MSTALFLPPVNHADALRLGAWLACKARQQARESGIQQAARNLRKQGVPMFLARQILLGSAA